MMHSGKKPALANLPKLEWLEASDEAWARNLTAYWEAVDRANETPYEAAQRVRRERGCGDGEGRP